MHLISTMLSRREPIRGSSLHSRFTDEVLQQLRDWAVPDRGLQSRTDGYKVWRVSSWKVQRQHQHVQLPRLHGHVRCQSETEEDSVRPRQQSKMRDLHRWQHRDGGRQGRVHAMQHGRVSWNICISQRKQMCSMQELFERRKDVGRLPGSGGSVVHTLPHWPEDAESEFGQLRRLHSWIHSSIGYMRPVQQSKRKLCQRAIHQLQDKLGREWRLRLPAL